MLLFDNVTTVHNYTKDHDHLTLRFDGSISKNPDGDMGWGWIVSDKNDMLIESYGWQIYDGWNRTTVNLAEWSGLYFGLKYILANLTYKKLTVIGDSQFTINCASGRYRIDVSKPYGIVAIRFKQEIEPVIENVQYIWQRRHNNEYCDGLASKYRELLKELVCHS